ncbi:MAG: hypothetical protein V7739_09495 [Motiliproteus sp.]
MQVSAIWIRVLGYISLATATVIFALSLLGQLPLSRPIAGYLFASGLMALVSGALIIAAKLRETNNPLAEKAVPSSLVAYLLFVLMTMHWLNN